MGALGLMACGAAEAGTLAVNFQGDRDSGVFGRELTQAAFGVEAEHWVSNPAHTATELDGAEDAVFEIGEVTITVRYSNDWAQGRRFEAVDRATGEDEVAFGFLDDGDGGAKIVIEGLEAWMAESDATSYTLRVIMSSGQENASFTETRVLDVEGGSELGIFRRLAPEQGHSGGMQGSDVLHDFFTDKVIELSSDTLFIMGSSRDGAARGGIAGFLLVNNGAEDAVADEGEGGEAEGEAAELAGGDSSAENGDGEPDADTDYGNTE